MLQNHSPCSCASFSRSDGVNGYPSGNGELVWSVRGLCELAKLKQLQWQSLSGTKVTNAGLKELAGFKQLMWLSLVGTQLTDEGLKELAGLEQLQWLVLSGTKVTDAGVAEFRSKRRSCHIYK
jgi:hypothetical protein